MKTHQAFSYENMLLFSCSYLWSAAGRLNTHQTEQPVIYLEAPLASQISWFSLTSSACMCVLMCVRVCVCVREKEKYSCVCALYWKASRNMSTTLMMMSSIMMRNTTTFWVSGGRLQRSRVLKNPIFCLLHLPEPLPRAISPLVSSSSSSSALLPLPCRLSLSAKPPHHTASPRPPAWLPPLLSSRAALHLSLASTVTSPVSPATLPMPSGAPACRWRLGADLCQWVWVRACSAPPIISIYPALLCGKGSSSGSLLSVCNQLI